MLHALWILSLGLSAAAMAIVAGLVAGRTAGSLLARRRKAERVRLAAILLGGGTHERSEIAAYASNTLTDLAMELVQMVRGTDREQFVETARELGVPERLRHRLGSGSARSRLEAAEALAAFADEGSIERLRAALDDPNADVRLAAALSLASADAAPPARQLVEKLRLGTHEQSRLIVSLFRDIARTRPDEIKGLVADPQTSHAIRAAAIEALSASGDYSLIPMINVLVLAADPEDEALPRYLHALGALGHPAALPAIRPGLASPVREVRAAAAEAAGKASLAELGDSLAAMLDDRHWWVRFRSAEALARMGESGRARLIAAARDGASEAKRTAATALAEWKLA